MKRLLALGVAAALVAFVPAAAVAQSAAYPAKPIRVIVPFPPGVPVDVIMRVVGNRLAVVFAQPVVIDNRPGAGANIGTELAARAPADGYTLLGTASNFVANPSLYAKVNYDPVRDFVPIAGLIRTPSILVVAADSPFRSVPEIVAAARAKPGALSYASGGNGSLAHFIRAGKLRALAVTAPKRMPQIPDVPTLREVLPPGFDLESENGLVAPAGVPPDVIARLNAEIVKILRDPAVADPLVESGYEVVGGTPAEFGARIAADLVKYADIVKRSGAKVD
jgi:tripartite-type tricarboxylate transporter receptor subunit TctC